MDYEGTAGKIKNDKMEIITSIFFYWMHLRICLNTQNPGGAIYVCHADTEGLNFRNAYKNAGLNLLNVWYGLKML